MVGRRQGSTQRRPRHPISIAAPTIKTDLGTIALRLDILSLALAEMAGALPAQEAARAADAICRRVTGRIASTPMSESADVSVAADLGPILAALRRH